MWGHRKMLANPQYGAVGLLSYLYFLFYELLSPFIELLGVLTMVLSVMMDMLNVKFMLAFVRVTVFEGYKKNKLNWGKMERK